MGKDVEMKDIAALLSDSNFIRLQKERSAFNTFDVLRLKHHEIRHSNVLAWLFDPQENHKFGSAFLEQFLLRLPACAESDEQKENISYALLKLAASGMHVSVNREKQSKDNKREDLHIKCFLPDVEDKRCRFVLLIENKTDSTESEGQLKGYLDSEKEKYKNDSKVKIIPVYLTLDEDDEPSDKRYFHLTYNDVLEILESLTSATYSERCEEPARLFIKDYINTLKELLNIDTKEQECAKEIYKNHKDAIDYFIRNTKNTNADKKYEKSVYRKYKDLIDFIFKNRENWMVAAGKQFVEQYKQSLEQNEDFKPIAIDKSNASFFPFTDTVLQRTEGGNDKDWRGGTVCGYYFRLYPKNEDDANGTLAFAIEVGPFADPEKRQNLLEALKSKGITCSKGSSGSSKYTRLSYSKLPGKSETIKDVTDVDEVATTMKKMFEKTKELREKLHEGITEWKQIISIS